MSATNTEEINRNVLRAMAGSSEAEVDEGYEMIGCNCAGIPLPVGYERIFMVAAQNGYMETIAFLHKKCSDYVKNITRSQNHECTPSLLRDLYPIGEHLAFNGMCTAIRKGYLDIVKFIYNNIPTVVWKNKPLLNWVFTSSRAETADKAKPAEMTRFIAEEIGCQVTKEAIRGAIFHDNFDVLRYLLPFYKLATANTTFLSYHEALYSPICNGNLPMVQYIFNHHIYNVHDTCHCPTKCLTLCNDAKKQFKRDQLQMLITAIDNCPTDKLYDMVCYLLLSLASPEFDLNAKQIVKTMNYAYSCVYYDMTHKHDARNDVLWKIYSRLCPLTTHFERFWYYF